MTNTSWYGWQKVEERFNLSKYFDYCALSFRLGLVKPDSKFFQAVRKKFKVKNNECLIVSDSLKNDILPAKKLGWQTLLLGKNCLNVINTLIKK